MLLIHCISWGMSGQEGARHKRPFSFNSTNAHTRFESYQLTGRNERCQALALHGDSRLVSMGQAHHHRASKGRTWVSYHGLQIKLCLPNSFHSLLLPNSSP